MKTRVLLITLSNIGDVILTTPVIIALRSVYPNAHLTVVVGPKAAPILQQSKLIDEVIIYDKRAGWKYRYRYWLQLAKFHYEAVVDLKNSAIPFLVCSKKRSPLFRKFKERNLRARHLEVLKMMGIEVLNPSWPTFDFYQIEDEQSLRKKLAARGCGEKGYIVVAPVAASSLKSWPLQHYEWLIEQLLGLQQAPIVIIGDPNEKKRMDHFKIASERVIFLAGETTLPEAACLIKHAKLLIANDSAAMHLGFEMNRPVVAVFGPTDHVAGGREGHQFRIVRQPVACAPCHLAACKFDRQACFEDLDPQRVLQACKELLRDV